ncbi:MAG: hypothetical protein V1779_09585 [bacterium]
MEYSELIHEFTDGTLETVREPELFNVLASNDELRTEFKQQLAMKSAIRTDAKAYTPAAQSTLNIFSSLGFVPPAPISAVTTGSTGMMTGSAVKSAGFFSKFGTALITGTVAVVSTGLIAYWIFNSQIDNLKNENNKLTVQMQNIKKQNEIPLVQNFAKDEAKENSANKSKAVEPEKVKIKYVYITKKEDRSQKTEDRSQNDGMTEGRNDGIMEGRNDGKMEETDNRQQITDNGELITENEVTFNNSQLFGPANFAQGLYSLNSFNEQTRMNRINPTVQFDDSYIGSVREDLGFSLEIVNMENWFDISPTISPKEYNKFNNTSITLLYSFLEDFQVGLDYKRETFFQRFEGKNEKGDLYRYEQQPNFTSYGMVLRYANKDFSLWDIYPYGQFVLGATNVGYILRYGGGLRYSPFNNLSFVLGVGSSSLFYKHDGSPWQSNRYDLNYGISFEF